MILLINILPLIIFGLLSILLLTKRVRFGGGLADIFYYCFSHFTSILYLTYFVVWVVIGTTNAYQLLLPLSFSIVGVYLLLKMTFWRGIDYQWDGFILAPKEGEREKRNQIKLEKELESYLCLLNENPDDYQSRIKIGNLYEKYEHYQAAIKEYLVAQKIKPNDISAYLLVGSVYRLTKDYQKAISTYEKAYQLDTTSHYKLRSLINRLKILQADQ